MQARRQAVSWFTVATTLAIAACLCGIAARATVPQVGAGGAMARAAAAWLATLDTDQRARAVQPFEAAARIDWHFVPKPARKGVQLRDMTEPQQAAAHALLRTALSQAGYDKSVGIMQLDELLRLLEGSKAKNIRDSKRYFFTIFGTPAEEGRWGLSVEGHHLSLNFTVRDGALVDSTPQCMGANPAVVKTTFPQLPAVGSRVLAEEETLAFALVKSLDADRRAKTVIAAEPPREIRAAGAPQPPSEPSLGIRLDELDASQAAMLRRLVDVYCGAMPAEVATERLRQIESAAGGWAAVRFAWQGSLEPGIGHGYRIEGPTFSVEFVNVQPDAEGNPANHIHCIWRDRTGDFDLPPSS